ncbi:MAG: T9SS type A sorting domain-containing protein [Flavobacteriales bacterium]|nr:T9SS type A sorting domain-containing protein [Flavobacteriales bacterium]
MARKIIFLFVLLLASSIQPVFANHSDGVDITYESIDSLVFEVTIKAYRSCKGVPYTMGQTDMKVRIGNATVTMTPTRVSITDITPVCKTVGIPCNPQNTYGTGDGMEMHVYKDTVDFTDSAYSGLLKNGCSVYFEYQSCCRNSSINTGAANLTLYSYAMLNICKAPTNSSPKHTTPPKFISCCNQPIFHNIGAVDSLNHDSLSYSLDQPLKCYGCPISYGSGYPITAYFPGTLKPPYNNPGANPPIGTYLNPETGDFIVTPVKCDEITTLVFKVNEWRKDSTGTYQLIGTTRQDVVFVVKTCPTNNPPTLSGPYLYSVCPGDSICFRVTTNDQMVSSGGGKQDSVDISWDRGIPQATFTLDHDSIRFQSGLFCWRPHDSMSSSLPYQFHVTARDDACPLNAVVTRSYNVLVKPRAKADIVTTSLPCSKLSVEARNLSNYNAASSFRWMVLDTMGNPLFTHSRTDPVFKNGQTISSLKKDTIQFRTSGVYILSLTVNNGAKCGSTIYDTIRVDSVFEARLAVQNDTFNCAGTDLSLRPMYSFGHQPVKQINWNTGDTSTWLIVQLDDTTLWKTIGLDVTDQQGCVAKDEITVFRRDNPIVSLPPDDLICFYDSILLTPITSLAQWDDPRTIDTSTVAQGSELRFDWKLDGTNISTDTALVVTLPGIYVLRISDSLNCSSSDNFQLTTIDFRADAGEDTSLCNQTIIDLRPANFQSILSNNSSASYWWNSLMGSSSQVISDSVLHLTQDTLLELIIHVIRNGVGCTDKDTVQYTQIDLPKLQTFSPWTICCNAGDIHLSDLSEPVHPGGTWWANDTNLITNNTFRSGLACGLDTAKSYSAYLTWTDPQTGCSSTTSTPITVLPKPEIGSVMDKSFCVSHGPVFPDKDGIVPSNVHWNGNDQTGYNYSFICLNCASGEWELLFHRVDTSGVPYFEIDHLGIAPANNQMKIVEFSFGYTNSYGCTVLDTAQLTILGDPVIDQSSFIPGTPSILCSETDSFQLRPTNYPYHYKIKSLPSGSYASILDDYFVPNELSKGFYRLQLKAVGSCPADSLDFNLEPSFSLDLLPNDTSIVSIKDHTYFIPLQTAYSGNVSWFTSSGGVLEKNTGLSNVVTLPHHRGTAIRTIPVTIVLTDKPACIRYWQDTLNLTLRPDPCSDFTFDKEGAGLSFSPEYSDLSAYVWKLDDGQTATSINPTFQDVDLSKPMFAHLTTVSSLADSCTISRYIDFSSIEPINNQIAIFPNPVSDQLHVSGFALGTGIIVNHLGQVVWSGMVIEQPIDCSYLKSGIYSLQVTDSTQRVQVIRTFIKR